MKILQRRWTAVDNWQTVRDLLGDLKHRAQLVLIFGATELLKNPNLYKDLREEFPIAEFVGCATAGEICGTELLNDSITITAVYFERSSIASKAIFLDQYPHANLRAVAKELVESLPQDDLVHVFVLSDGIEINGSVLVKGFREVLPDHVGISGGLSGDYYRFKEAPVIANVMACKNTVVVIGLYGRALRVMTASRAGWEEFGAEKQVTKSDGNTLYELDGESALPLYERYLGDSFKDVPASSIQYPISLKKKDGTDWITRTIININREAGSLVFAGDVPVGCTARLMKTDTELLVDSARKAAQDILKNSSYPELAILISCFGRRGAMLQDCSKEIEAINTVFGDETTLTGFYSYGEIAPFRDGR